MSLIDTDWDFARLEELIEARGEQVIHETGISCTCRSGDYYASTIMKEGFPAGMRSTPFCKICEGEGWLYRNARVIKGLVTSVNPNKDRKLIESGYLLPGDSIFSPSLNAGVMNDLDKITFLFPVPLSDGQVIMRGAANMEDNATLDTGLSVGEDRLWYEADSCIWCEDENGVVYTPDVDFTLSGKRISWVNGPTVGTLYTIKYTGYVEWIAYSGPFARFDRNRNLGQRVVLRKKHVVLESGPDNTPTGRQAEEVSFTTRKKI